MIGVGIFFTPARVAAAVDNAWQALAAWGLGGLVAILGALVFAELSRRIPGHGGTFLFIERGVGRLPAFLYGWSNWLAIQSGALAVVGLVCVEYIWVLARGPGAQVPGSLDVWLAAVLIAVLTATNAVGLHVGKRVQNALTVTKLVAVFLLVGVALLGPEGSASMEPAPTREPRGLLLALAAAMLPVMFSFGGWQQGTFIAGAARRPERDVPLGVLAGTAVVVLAYSTINLSFLSLLGFEEAAASSAIGAEAAAKALAPLGIGDLAARLFAVLVVSSALGVMNTIVLAPPYVLHAMAQRRLFFASAGRLHPRFHVPMLAVLVQGGWGVVILFAAHLFFGDARHTIGFLLDGVIFVDWVFFTLSGVALLVMLRRDGGGQKGLRTALLALAFTLAGAAIATGAVASNPQASLAGVTVIAVGLLAYLRLRR